MNLWKKWLSAAVSVTMIASAFAVPANVKAEDSWETPIIDIDLTDKEVAAPEAWGAVPSPNQYRYQKEELAAFCHFGPNTFNEVEWGESYGSRAPAEIFTLQQDFDAETMVKTLKEAGFKKLIVTAKHHDGFCIWASEYTTYDVASTNYKDGKGDVLAEISAACTKYDMDMGLYLSPWDIHEPSYGYYDANRNPTTKENDVLDYNEYYNNQLREILGNDKYGNDGHFVEVWMDGAKGSGANAQDYEFQKWFNTIQSCEGKAAGYDDDCMLFGAEAYTTVRWIGNELGLAAEETWSKSRTNKEANTIDSNRSGAYTKGFYDGNQWTVPEADARITSGWFWGNTKKTPKTIADLANMYFNSVGHNATLLLNVPPNNQGKVDQPILDRVKEFGENVRDSFKDNLAKNASISASAVRGNAKAFSPENVIDGDDATYWTMDDGQTTGSITLDLGGTKTFDLVTIEEAIRLGQRISGFSVEYRLGDGAWQTFASGTTIGAKRICREKPVKADKVRINITASYAVPLISEVGVYKATEGFEISSPIPDGLEQVGVTDKDTSDGSGWTYTGWNAESGTQFISGNGIWANSGKEATLTFRGTKVWLYGTKDPGHGTADIYIDNTKVASINTKSSPRETGQVIFESETLQSGNHTLRIVNTGTIGLDTAAVLNNGGAGLVQFDLKRLEMEEDSVKKLLVRRIGGSNGEIRVAYENNPGSAVQGNYDVDGIQGELVFADGETEKEITVTTKRDVGYKGDLDFTVDLVSATGNAILGSSSVKVVIRDMDDDGRVTEAEQLIEEIRTLTYDLYERAGQETVKELAAQLEAYLEAKEIVKPADIIRTAIRLKEAKNALVPVMSGPSGDTYTSEDRFVMPLGGAAKMVEAEWFLLDATGAADANKYVRLTERADASNGKEVNWFENGNRIILPFTAEKAGTYKVKATYRSGRAEASPNAFEWSGTNVTAGSKDVYGETNATIFHTAEFDVTVTAPGEGELVFTAGTKGGPVIDKFEIVSTEQAQIINVTGVTLGESEIILTDDNSYTYLKAVITPADATNKKVSFTSSDPSVATVTDKGLVVAVPGVVDGKTVITVKTEDGEKTAECRILVNPKSEEVKAKEAALAQLQDELKKAESVVAAGKGNYTDVSWNAFVNAYNRAKAVDEKTDTAEIRKLMEAFKTAKEGLQINQPEQPVQPAEPVKDGQNFDSGNFRYKVTSVSAQTVEVTALKNANLSAIRIYNTVVLGGKSYKITSVAPSAFKNNKKITSLTVGKNVKTIGSSAFAGCTGLKKAVINSKGLQRIDSKAFSGCKKLGSIRIRSTSLKKVGKNAFKGISKKAVIRVPASKLKVYKKVLAKKGQSRTVKITK